VDERACFVAVGDVVGDDDDASSLSDRDAVAVAVDDVMVCQERYEGPWVLKLMKAKIRTMMRTMLWLLEMSKIALI
jgi:hypothetical protein